jgi:adenine phosphoribosyltransferase
MKLKDTFEDLMYVNLNGYRYFVHPLTDGTSPIWPADLQEFGEWARKQIDISDVDYLLTAEAMGIPVAISVSMETGIPLLIARKRPYGLPGEILVTKKTGYSKENIYVNGLESDDHVVFVDDVLDTGGTLKSIAAALEEHSIDVEFALFLVSKRTSPKSADVGFPIKAFVEIE